MFSPSRVRRCARRLGDAPILHENLLGKSLRALSSLPSATPPHAASALFAADVPSASAPGRAPAGSSPGAPSREARPRLLVQSLLPLILKNCVRCAMSRAMMRKTGGEVERVHSEAAGHTHNVIGHLPLRLQSRCLLQSPHLRLKVVVLETALLLHQVGRRSRMSGACCRQRCA